MDNVMDKWIIQIEFLDVADKKYYGYWTGTYKYMRPLNTKLKYPAMVLNAHSDKVKTYNTYRQALRGVKIIKEQSDVNLIINVKRLSQCK